MYGKYIVNIYILLYAIVIVVSPRPGKLLDQVYTNETCPMTMRSHEDHVLPQLDPCSSIVMDTTWKGSNGVKRGLSRS